MCKDIIIGRGDFAIRLVNTVLNLPDRQVKFLKILHLPVRQVKNRIRKPDSRIHQPQAIRHYFLCTLQVTLKTEFTSLIAKSPRPGLSHANFFAH